MELTDEQKTRAFDNLLKAIDEKRLAVVPCDPTEGQLEAYWQIIREGQSIYEDAGGYMMRRIKSFITGKPVRDCDHITYDAILEAVDQKEILKELEG